MADRYRPRRSCLSVPASSERFIAKARDLAADEVFLDLEDAVAPGAKDGARRNAVAALTSGSWRAGIRAVRVNDATTPWAYQDVVALVEKAGSAVDVIILPKVTDPGHLIWLDLLFGHPDGGQEDRGDPGGKGEVVPARFRHADIQATLGLRSLRRCRRQPDQRSTTA